MELNFTGAPPLFKASMPGPIGPTIFTEEVNAMASRGNPSAESSLSLEKSNVQVSMPGPIGPTEGLDRGESVISSGFNGGVTGGVKKKAERRCQGNTSSTVMFEGEPVTLMKKRPVDPEKLAELARVDPQKFKRIVSNRNSAAASRKRMKSYEDQLKEEIKSLQTRKTDALNNLIRVQKNSEKMHAQYEEVIKQIDVREQILPIRQVTTNARERRVLSLNIETDHYAVILRPHTAAELFPQFSSQLPLEQFHNPPIFPQHVAIPQQPLFHMPNPFPPPTQNFNEQYGLNFPNYFNPLN